MRVILGTILIVLAAVLMALLLWCAFMFLSGTWPWKWTLLWTK